MYLFVCNCERYEKLCAEFQKKQSSLHLFKGNCGVYSATLHSKFLKNFSRITRPFGLSPTTNNNKNNNHDKIINNLAPNGSSQYHFIKC